MSDVKGTTPRTGGGREIYPTTPAKRDGKPVRSNLRQIASSQLTPSPKGSRSANGSQATGSSLRARRDTQTQTQMGRPRDEKAKPAASELTEDSFLSPDFQGDANSGPAAAGQGLTDGRTLSLGPGTTTSMPPLLPAASTTQPANLRDRLAAVGAGDSPQSRQTPLRSDSKRDLAAEGAGSPQGTQQTGPDSKVSSPRPVMQSNPSAGSARLDGHDRTDSKDSAPPDYLSAPLQEILTYVPRADRDKKNVQRAIGAIQAKLEPSGPRIDNLKIALGRHLPRTVAERDHRIEATALALDDIGVRAIDLPRLIRTSRLRDGVRHWTAVLRTGLSFLPAAGTGLGLALNPPNDASEYRGNKADDVGERNIYAAYLIGLLCMGAGGQVAARVVEDGKLGPKYNKPAPVSVESDGTPVPYADTTRAMVAKGLEFWPFSVGHSIAGSNALDLGAVATARAFLVSTFCSSVATGISSAVLDEALPKEGLDYTWLDASTPDKAKDMEMAIEHLKEGSCVAVVGYVKDIGKGIAGLWPPPPGKQALKGTLFRLIAAVVATFPRLFYASTKNEYDKAVFGVVAGLWIGLTWGWLGMGLFPPVNDPNARSASRARVEEVEPPDPQAATHSDSAAARV